MDVMDLHKPVLLVTKKSFYERYALDRKDSHFLRLVEADDRLAEELIRDYEENRSAIAAVERFLAARGLDCERTTSRSDQAGVDGKYGLVVALGGDGTLLAASHWVVTTPLVGVNTRPGRSIGYFCASDISEFEGLLESIFDDERTARELWRMELFVNGERKGPLVLNDLLYAGANPAASTAYRISVGERDEQQMSSGVWVSTPAGSTGGIRAAGGVRQKLGENRLQFVVREPYRGRGLAYALEKGKFVKGFSITNLTPEARVFVDGSRIQYNLNYGDVVEARVSSHPLVIFL